MSVFESQRSKPSRTNRSLGRIAYLEKAFDRPAVEDAIRRYFADQKAKGNETPEEVTLAVLAFLGKDQLLKAGAGRTLDRVKQDVGLWVPIILGEMFGEDNVYTARKESGGAAAPRRKPTAGWDALDWVSNFTPHRVSEEQPAYGSKGKRPTATLKQLLFGGPSLEGLDLDR